MDGFIIGFLILANLFISGLWWNERQERIAAENNAIRSNEYILTLAKRIRATADKTNEIDEHAEEAGWGTK